MAQPAQAFLGIGEGQQKEDDYKEFTVLSSSSRRHARSIEEAAIPGSWARKPKSSDLPHRTCSTGQHMREICGRGHSPCSVARAQVAWHTLHVVSCETISACLDKSSGRPQYLSANEMLYVFDLHAKQAAVLPHTLDIQVLHPILRKTLNQWVSSNTLSALSPALPLMKREDAILQGCCVLQSSVIADVKSALALPRDDEKRTEAIQKIRDETTKWVAKYRRDNQFGGRASFG